MRLVILALLGSTALLAGQAAVAQSPVAVAPLASGEVLLEVNALGVARTRADVVTLTASVNSTGATEAAARAETDARLARLAAVARSMGVSAQGIRAMAVPMVYAPPAPPPPPAPPRPIAVAPPAPPSAIGAARSLRRSAYGNMEVRLSDPGRVDALRRALEVAGADNVSPPVYALSDERAARRAARADALATARADAEAYAASLGLRVLRMVRVTERVGLDVLSMLGGNRNLPGRLRARGEGAGSEVETPVMVGVDFVLGPR